MAHTLPQQAIIFDMDGLLIDSEPLWHQSEIQIFDTLGVNIAEINSKELIGIRIDQVVELYYQHSPWQGPSRQEVVNLIVDRTIEQVAEKRPLMAGVFESLHLAKSLNLKLGLASASPMRLIRSVVDLFDLEPFFDTVCSAENLPYSKPHPEIYLMAANNLNVSPTRCSACEDSITGMIATKAARMRSIAIPDKGLRNDPRWSLADIRLSSLLELKTEHLL